MSDTEDAREPESVSAPTPDNGASDVPPPPPPPARMAPPGEAPPMQENSMVIKSAAERKAILAQQLQFAAARGRRVESQSDFQAVLIAGKPINHTLHAVLTIFTCLLWGIVWIVIALTGGETRELLLVDEYGNVQIQKMGKA